MEIGNSLARAYHGIHSDALNKIQLAHRGLRVDEVVGRDLAWAKWLTRIGWREGERWWRS